ncbi:MAG TPA: DUF4012 domain-containing protein [Leifsonia sp.]
MQSAQGELTTFKSALGQPNAPSTVELYTKLSANTAKADQQTHDPVWRASEAVPFLGPNLKAFRQTADLTDTLVRNGVQPIAVAANGLSVDSLKPKNGAIDIAPLKRLTPAMSSLDDALRAADASAAAIDTKDVLPQLKAPIASLQATLQKAMPITAELRKVMPVLYPALGGDGTRHYLLIFQNNAEERASGGNPAAMAMLDVSHGKIKLGKQPNSGDFPHPYPVPPLTWKGAWSTIYGFHTAAYVTNITFTPDFPQTARMARAMWRTQFGGTVDGVISFDPVALSYLMRATGPIKLPTGEVLTSSNAVQYLLSDVYAKYTDPTVQNVVFSSAAKAIFSAVTSGQGSPKAYVAQLAPMLAEQRLKAWSNRKNEEDLLLTSPAGNMLPADNSKATTIGVYNNDDATSKMSYYMDATVGVDVRSCAVPTYVVTTKVTDTLRPDQVSTLTPYVLAAQARIPQGGDRQWVQIYGPVGSKLVSATIDGVRVIWGNDESSKLNTVLDATGQSDYRPAVKGVLYGRPVGSVSITMGPTQSVTVQARFSGATGASPVVEVSHTPKVRPVPVTITKTACG